jgi:hypothetical protein
MYVDRKMLTKITLVAVSKTSITYLSVSHLFGDLTYPLPTHTLVKDKATEKSHQKRHYKANRQKFM